MVEEFFRNIEGRAHYNSAIWGGKYISTLPTVTYNKNILGNAPSGGANGYHYQYGSTGDHHFGGRKDLNGFYHAHNYRPYQMQNNKEKSIGGNRFFSRELYPGEGRPGIRGNY